MIEIFSHGGVMSLSRDPEVFWADFEVCLLQEGVGAEKVKWFLGWARRFAARMQAMPLREHSAEFVVKGQRY